MAELPEVEAIRRQLYAEVAGHRFTRVVAVRGRMFRTPAPAVAKALKGARLDKVGRRGKALLLEFEGGRILLVHLGMSGQVLLCPPVVRPEGHVHLEAELDDGRSLVFRDYRRFGYYRLASAGELDSLRELRNIGLDPTASGFTWERFSAELKGRRGFVKPLLMDQALFAGIGNIYADEILHAARLLPSRAVETLTPAELKELFHAIRDILAQSISCGGTSFDDAFCDIFGKPGLFGGRLAVYGREGEQCQRCSQTLKVAKSGGRTSVFCPHCQR